MYGFGHTEEFLSKFLSETTTNVTLATKFGIRQKPGRYQRPLHNSPAYARASCEASLKRLGRDHIEVKRQRYTDEGMKGLNA